MEFRAADRKEDARVIGEVMARAFHDDPVIGWLRPSDTAGMFATLATYVHALPTLVFREGEPVAAALWDPPGHHPSEQEQNDSLTPFVACMGDAIDRGLALEETFAKHRPAEPHWYLAQIGTVPAAQGLGIGGALMEAGLARRDGLPAYLESSKESNIPFYEKFGFTVTQTIELPGGPTVWGMWLS